MKNFKTLWKRIYSHFFQTMPGEMTMKGFWNSYRIVANHYLDGKYDLSELAPATVNKCINGGGKNLFVYWDSGFEAAPPVVKQCLKSVKAHVPTGWQLHVISEENVAQYIRMPDFVREMVQTGNMCRAHYSDILRFSLLWHYGGLWLDATCLLTKDIPDIILDSPLFLFNNKELWQTTPFLFENWVMRSEPKNYVIGRLLEDCLCYFKHCKNPRGIYFVNYYLLSALYLKDCKAKAQFDEMPWWYAKDAFLMQIGYGFSRKVTNQQWKFITDKCFVQKLIYRYPQEWNEGTDTVIGRVFRKYNSTE